MELVLRWYQNEMVASARQHMVAGRKRVCCQLATGGGKSAIFSDVARRTIARGGNIMVTVHRHELLKQAIANLRIAGIQPAVALRDEGWRDAPAAVGMIPGLAIAMSRGLVLPNYKLFVADECHHCCADTWDQVFSSQTGYQLGMTATPHDRGMDRYYDVMVQGPSAQQLTDEGFLARIKGWYDPKGFIVGSRLLEADATDEALEPILGDFTKKAIRVWKTHANKLPTMGFCGSRRVGRFFETKFREAGIAAAFVDGAMHPDKRAVIFDEFTGQIEFLWSCNLVDEGVDVPGTVGIMLAARTDSLRQHLQRIGRGMRPKRNGGPMILMDLAGNVQGVKGSPGHGLPTDVLGWTIEGAPIFTTARQQEREMQAATRRRVISAKASGKVEKIPDCLEEAKTLEQAVRFIKEPKDYLRCRPWVRSKKGEKLTPLYLIAQAALHFFRRPGEWTWSTSLMAAARAVEMEGYVIRALERGVRITVVPPRPVKR